MIRCLSLCLSPSLLLMSEVETRHQSSQGNGAGCQMLGRSSWPGASSGSGTSCLINSWQLGPLQHRLIELTGWIPPWNTWHSTLCWEGNGLLCSLIPSPPPTHCPSQSLLGWSPLLPQPWLPRTQHSWTITRSRFPWPSFLSSLWPGREWAAGGGVLTQGLCCTCKDPGPLNGFQKPRPIPSLPTGYSQSYSGALCSFCPVPWGHLCFSLR